MRKILIIAALLAACGSTTAAQALDSGAAAPVVVTPVKTTATTATGQPLVLPRENVEVTASIYDIAPGAKLPVHKHPYARYGYMLSGTLRVTNVDTGKSDIYKTGDFIVEMIDQWHQGSNVGADPVKLLVIDQIEAGAKATILKQ